MLSAVILAHNEEENIERCLKSVQFASETIVIDDNSTDKTAAIAKKHGATVYTRALKNDFSSQRAFGAQKAQHDWILFVDADEEVSPHLAREIQELFDFKTMNQAGNGAYYIRRRDHFWGKPVTHGELSTAYRQGFIRLVKKGSGQWQGEVHETYITHEPAGKLEGVLEHYPHQNITTFLQEINHYSTLRAEELHHAGHTPSVFEIMAYPFGKFIYTYFIKQGFRDGAAGFVYSFLMSFHSFLVRAKLYQYRNLDVGR